MARHTFRFVSALTFSGFACMALGQAGGGAGGGFGGGGFGGASAASLAEGDEVVKTHILTPGDRGEWPITAKENETVIVSAQTNVFDAALEIVGKDNKVLAQNDDVRPGEQNPLLLFRFPKPGEYKILVKGYKSAAGGQYTFKLRRFVSDVANVGSPATGHMGKTGVRWLRFPADAGKTLVVLARGLSDDHVEASFFAPNGESLKEAEDDYLRQGSRTVLEPETAGEHYVRLSSSGRDTAKFELRVLRAKEIVTSIGGGKKREKLEPGGLHHWTFEAKKGDLVTIDASDSDAPLTLEIQFLPREKETAVSEAEIADSAAVRLIAFGGKGRAKVVELLRKAGAYRISISERSRSPVDYSLSVEQVHRPIPESSNSSAQLAVGASDVWTFDAKSGEVVQMEGSAEQFDMMFEVFGPDGQPVTYSDDAAGSFNPKASFLLTQTGRYAVRVGSMGGGGSGAYRLSWQREAVTSIPQGTWEARTLAQGAIGYWNLKGREGQTVVFQVRSAEFEPLVVILGPDGRVLSGLDRTGVPSDIVYAVQLPASGTYTIGVTGERTGGKYTIRWVDLEK